MNLSLMTGLLSTVIGVFYTIQAFMIRNATIGNPMAPKVFPLALGILLIIFGLIQTVKESKGGFNLNLGAFQFDRSTKMIITTCGASILYALTFNRLGYVLSTVLFLEIILTLFNGRENWKINTTVALVFSIFIFVVFNNLLGIMLPKIPIINI